MKNAGSIMHIAGSGRAIIRLKAALPEGQVLYDSKGTKVARVMELIGPVSGPMASAALLTNNTKKSAGSDVFTKDGPAGGRR
ncbi:hypothetical protein CENSYa_1412 [Cenarchaeum symbiosum A]|uniref:Uncharacterized protein n=1 Tax=Cenarchaeum symbiosum (strain A) TaxID=414004 RepID=A0RXG7_CENSY|nr:hypothetical protein CENSYa_1412 [Cenarchaeum symbiosum A]